MLREAEHDTRGQTEAVLYIGSAVRELGAEPVCLNRPDREVARQADIAPPTLLAGRTSCNPSAIDLQMGSSCSSQALKY